MSNRDVFLNAGGFFFHTASPEQKGPLVVRTLLGSCVSIVLWSEMLGHGGMSHSVLPVRTSTYGPHDGNHCEGAMALFLRNLERTRTHPRDYATYLIGGSRMSLGLKQIEKSSVGERNVGVSRALLIRAGFSIAGEHVGHTGPRRVSFDLLTGRIEVLHNNRSVELAAGR